MLNKQTSAHTQQIMPSMHNKRAPPGSRKHTPGRTHTNQAGDVWLALATKPLVVVGTSNVCAPHRATLPCMPQYIVDASEKAPVASTAKSLTPHDIVPLGRRMNGPALEPTVVVAPVSKFVMLVGFCVNKKCTACTSEHCTHGGSTHRCPKTCRGRICDAAAEKTHRAQ